MSKFKVGDRVVIVGPPGVWPGDSEEASWRDVGPFFAPEMDQYLGKVGEIQNYRMDDWAELSIDNRRYTWDEAWLRPVQRVYDGLQIAKHAGWCEEWQKLIKKYPTVTKLVAYLNKPVADRKYDRSTARCHLYDMARGDEPGGHDCVGCSDARYAFISEEEKLQAIETIREYADKHGLYREV